MTPPAYPLDPPGLEAAVLAAADRPGVLMPELVRACPANRPSEVRAAVCRLVGDGRLRLTRGGHYELFIRTEE